MKLTDKELYDNRLKFVKGLQEPERKKAILELERIDGDGKLLGRCCLGHGCNIFDIIRTININYNVFYGISSDQDYAPDELIKLLGLFDRFGGIDSDIIISKLRFESLAEINDKSDLTTQQIGELLEPLIMGGEGTPFTKINIDS